MTLLIDNYDSFTYNLYQVVISQGTECTVFRNDAIALDEIRRLAPSRIILSPGPGKPDGAGITLAVINAFKGKIPIVGICLGHQAIGQSFGAKIIRAPQPKHGKISKVLHSAKDAYADFPNPFNAARYHSLVVDRVDLPNCFEITCETRDGIVMGLRHKQYAIDGVQFHPESIATQSGATLLKRIFESQDSRFCP